MALPVTQKRMLNAVAWPPQLPFDLALGLRPLDEILEQHGLGWAEWSHIQSHPVFKSELAAAHSEITESGLSFRRKAATQAEMYLEELDALMMNPDVAPTTKVDIFKTLVKCGDLEPAPKKNEELDQKQTFNIQINL